MSHGPLHVDAFNPVTPPYRPAAHALHAATPPREYWPVAHTAAVALMDPATHAYPGVHGPVHSDVVKPVDAPYRPPAHRPLHAALGRLVEAP